MAILPRHLPVVFGLAEGRARSASSPVVAMSFSVSARTWCAHLRADYARRADTLRLSRLRLVQPSPLCGADSPSRPSGFQWLRLARGRFVLEIAAGDAVDRWQLEVNDSLVLATAIGRPMISRLAPGSERIVRMRPNTVAVRCAGEEPLCDDVWREVAEVRGLRRLPLVSRDAWSPLTRHMDAGGEVRVYAYASPAAVERLFDARAMLFRQLPRREWSFTIATWDAPEHTRQDRR